MKCEFPNQLGLRLPISICARSFSRSISRESHERQTFDDAAVQEMFFDNLRNVCGANLCVPNAVRINHHRSPNRAETHRSAFGQHHASFRIFTFRFSAKQNSVRFQLTLERFLYFGAVSRGAGLAGADENMMTDWR